LSGCIFAAKAYIDNRKKNLLNIAICPHDVVNFGLLTASLGHPCKFQRVSRLGSVTARHCSSGRQPDFAALNRRRHLYSAGRPSRWALPLAHIPVRFITLFYFCNVFILKTLEKWHAHIIKTTN